MIQEYYFLLLDLIAKRQNLLIPILGSGGESMNYYLKKLHTLQEDNLALLLFLVILLIPTLISQILRKLNVIANKTDGILDKFFGLIYAPFVLPSQIIKSPGNLPLRVLGAFLFIVIVIPLWFFSTLNITIKASAFSRGLASNLGILQEESYIAGTGSMHPTFPKGSGQSPLEQMREVVGSVKVRKFPGGVVFAGKRYFDYKLEHGDIVFFSSDNTKKVIASEFNGVMNPNVGFVKRVIAISGDKIEIRDGFVKLNDNFLQEPYIAKARSTYGGTYLADCKPLVIPEGYVFVMGDNRKSSNDSRFDVEVVALEDIRSVIPISQQDNLKANYRNTSDDLSEANKPTLSSAVFLQLLNQKRVENGLKPLSYQEKLERSAKKRAEVILKFNDFSYEATKSGYTMDKATSEVGYSNIVWGEAPTLGYYDAQELIDNSFQFPSRKKFLLNKEYQETGIGVAVGEINGCPVQVVVQHLAGYVPPNYKTQDIETVKSTISRLEEIQPSWEELKTNTGYGQFYQEHKEDVDKLISVINLRINNLNLILQRMEANQWLTAEEKKLLEEDSTLFKEQESLANKLNNS